jgi:hypothetical protein
MKENMNLQEAKRNLSFLFYILTVLQKGANYE